MTVKGFETIIDPVILERGRAYFNSRAVVSLEKEEDDWYALVEGTETYQVFLEGIRTIKDWSCDCPYDHGPICKHIAAVLYAIRGAKKQSSKAKKNDIDLLFEKVSKERLLTFFRKNLRYHRDLKNKLLIEFADQLASENSDAYYPELLKNIISGFKSNYGYIHDSRKLARGVSKILSKAQAAFSGKNYLDTFAICKAIISALPREFESTDDSGGDLYDCVISAFNLIEQMLTGGPAIEFRGKIYNYLLEEAEKEKYEALEIDYKFLDLLIDFQTLATFNRLEVVLLNKLAATNNSTYGNYSLAYFVDLLIYLYQENEFSEQAEALIKEYLYLPRIRQIEVESLLEVQNYERAKQTVLEGLQIADKLNHSGTVNSWKQWLIEIAKLEGDTDTHLQLLEEYYMGQWNHDSEAFKALKLACPKKDWPDKRVKIIRQIESNKSSLGNSKYIRIAFIFEEEEMYPDLLALLQRRKNDRFLIRQFYEDIIFIFPTETLELLEPFILQQADEMGRGKYQQLANLLKGLIKVKGGRTFVDKLVKQFRYQYANRPAMMEELSIF